MEKVNSARAGAAREYLAKYELATGQNKISSQLLSNFVEYLRIGAQDEQLEREIVQELCKLEDKEVTKIFDKVSKLGFASVSCPKPHIPSKRPAISVSASIVSSASAELYTPMSAMVRVGVTSAAREQETQTKCLKVMQHAQLGYDSGVAVYSSHMDLGTLYPEMVCDVKFEFVIFQQGARYRRLHLFEFGSGSSEARCTYFRPILCDISLKSLEAETSNISHAPSASSSALNTTPLHQSQNIPLRRSIGAKRAVVERIEALVAPTAAQRIPECLTWAQDLDQVAVGVRLKIPQWYDSKLMGVKQLIRFWPFASQFGPITYSTDFWQTMHWHDRFEHKNLAPRVASTCLGKAPFVIYDATSETLYSWLKTWSFDAKSVLELLLAIAEPLAYLHGTGHTHGRLWPTCVTFKGGNVLRMIDYDDFARTPPKCATTEKHITVDSFAAPEVFTSRAYVASMDVFSFGLLMWYIFDPTHEPPRTKCKQVYDGNAPLLISQNPDAVRLLDTFGLASLYQSCTQMDVAARPTMQEIVIALLSIQGHPEMKFAPTTQKTTSVDLPL